MSNILFVTHSQAQCGVFQYGFNSAMILQHSTKYNFIYVQCNQFNDLRIYAEKYQPVAIIYNYHAAVIPWLNDHTIQHLRPAKCLVIHHEPLHQRLPDSVDAVLSQDPDVEEDGKLFALPRILHDYTGPVPINDKLTIGSFGFGLFGKQFDQIVKRVCEEFDEANIRLHISHAYFGDWDGVQARSQAAVAAAQVSKPGIQLHVSHNWLSKVQLLEFLAGNDLNLFMYADLWDRGNSSVLDFALSVPRPMAINKSGMFRHVWRRAPEILIEDHSLREILANGEQPLLKIKEEWTPAKLQEKYERILDQICK